MYRTIGIISLAMICWSIALESVQAQRARERIRSSQVLGNSDRPAEGYTTAIFVDEKVHELKDGLDLSRKDLSYIRIDRENTKLKNINFSSSSFYQSDFLNTDFVDCDFSGATFANACLGTVRGCNFQNAVIKNTAVSLNAEQLLSTSNYKRKGFIGFQTYGQDYSGISFAGFNLTYCYFSGCNLTDCDFTDATIEGAHLSDLSLRVEQLLVTSDFKNRFVKEITFGGVWPEHVVDLSKTVFIDCAFTGSGAKIDLTDSVISGCSFFTFGGLTIENVKSTWNYKNNQMENVRLPKSIQEALNAEKEQQ